MIYSTCPTCGFFIGNVVEEYEKQKKYICSKKMTIDKENKEIQKVILKLGLRRYCCRMRVMTCKNMVEEIQSIKN